MGKITAISDVGKLDSQYLFGQVGRQAPQTLRRKRGMWSNKEYSEKVTEQKVRRISHMMLESKQVILHFGVQPTGVLKSDSEWEMEFCQFAIDKSEKIDIVGVKYFLICTCYVAN